jgi:hypothetical protein
MKNLWFQYSSLDLDGLWFNVTILDLVMYIGEESSILGDQLSSFYLCYQMVLLLSSI